MQRGVSFASLSLALILLGVLTFAQASQEEGKGNYSRILFIAAGTNQRVLVFQAWHAGREEQRAAVPLLGVGWGGGGLAAVIPLQEKPEPQGWVWAGCPPSSGCPGPIHGIAHLQGWGSTALGSSVRVLLLSDEFLPDI